MFNDSGFLPVGTPMGDEDEPMTPSEQVAEYVKTIVLDGPCLLMVDAEKVDVAWLARFTLPELKHSVLIVPVIGKPDAIKFTIKMLEDALEKLRVSQ
jgi:hypothetical protein